MGDERKDVLMTELVIGEENETHTTWNGKERQEIKHIEKGEDI